MWFFFALTFAALSSILTLVAKKFMQKMEEYTYLLISDLFTLPFLLLIVLSFFQIPKIDNTFIIAIAGSVIIGVVAAILAYRAIRISDISLVNPFSAFNPVFTAIVAYFILGEEVGIRRGLGILLVVIGAYLLKISKAKKGIFAPIKALAKHRGVQMSLIAYFLWGVTPSFQKTAILHTSPQVPPFVSMVGMLGAVAVYLPIVMRYSSEKPIKLIKKNAKPFIVIGILSAIANAVAFIAISLTSLGIVTAVFKLSMIFTVILGWLFFKEKDIKERLLGTFVMLTGVILLVT